MGNQHGKERRVYGRRIDWENAEKPSPPGKPYLVPEGDEWEADLITIRWAPPVSDGGAPILGYVVEHRRTGSPHWLRAVPYLAVETKLTLTGLEPGWRYQFRVSAENELGRSPPGEVSDVLTVTSQRTAATSPHFNVELQDTVALENEKVEFTVHVVAIPQAKISWYKDGFEVFSSRRMKIVTENDESTFIIHQAAFEDEGEIKCTATNRAGHSVTKAILKLEAPPRIRLPRQYEDGLLFEKGELVRLKVSTAGRPPPLITWYHDGELLQNGQKYEIINAERSSSLRINEAQREDRGEYQIKGVNKIGEDLASFLVTVTDRPTPPGKAQVTMALGRSVTLSWTSPEDDGGCKIGNYIVEYYRMGWNMWLKASTCRQLSTVMGDLIEGSEYKFRVKAENPYGVSDPGEESDVIFIPDPKRGILCPPTRKDQEETDLWSSGVEPKPNHSELKSEKRKVLEENARKLLDTPMAELLAEENTIKSHPRKLGSVSSANTTERVKRSFENVDAENIPPPVPKRRHKREKPRSSASPSMPMETDTSSTTEELSRDEEGHGVAEDDEEFRFPREKDHTLFHGSSELMLVLLPDERSKSVELSVHQRSEIEMNLMGTGIAPPMSLSAPELGSDEPMELPAMRDAVSSSELLHERAIARLYQDAVLEESQILRSGRYSGDRKSVERRSSLRDGSFLERRNSLQQRTESETCTDQRSKIPIKSWNKRGPSAEKQNEVVKELIGSQIPVPKKNSPERMSSIEREELEFALVRERIRMKNEQNLRRRENLSEASTLSCHQSSGSGPITSSGEEDERMEDDDMEEDEGEEEDNYLDEKGVEEEEVEEEEAGEISAKETEILRDRRYRPKSIVQKYTSPPVPEHGVPSRKALAPFAEEEDDSCLAITSRIILPRLEITLPPTIEVPEDAALIEDRKTSPVKCVEAIKPKTGDKEEYFSKIPVKTGKGRAVKILKKLGLKKDKKIPEIIVEVDSSISGSPLPRPKPILKNKATAKRKEKETGKITLLSKEQMSTSCDDASDDGLSGKKKKQVRIAEPSDEVPISVGEEKEASEEEQANKVLIYHYSDIVREFGHGKKLPPKQYLSREELKAFVVEEVAPSPTTNAFPVPKGKAEDRQSPVHPSAGAGFSEKTELTSEERAGGTFGSSQDAQLIPAATRTSEKPAKARTTIDYLTDVIMFLIACWLYLFEDELYAVPVLCLMTYRQVNDAMRGKWANLKEFLWHRFSRKKAEG